MIEKWYIEIDSASKAMSDVQGLNFVSTKREWHLFRVRKSRVREINDDEAPFP